MFLFYTKYTVHFREAGHQKFINVLIHSLIFCLSLVKVTRGAGARSQQPLGKDSVNILGQLTNPSQDHILYKD